MYSLLLKTNIPRSLITKSQTLPCLTKQYSQKTTPSDPEKTLKEKNKFRDKYKDIYTCVYKFNYINHIRLFSRMKIYQTIASGLSGIGSVFLYDAGFVQNYDALVFLNGSMVFALAMLFVISRQTVKVVGRIYVSDDNQKVLLSHLNFMGKRRDIELDADLIEPLSSIDELNERYMSLRLKNMDGAMYVYLASCEIYDKKRFLEVFQVQLKDKSL